MDKLDLINAIVGAGIFSYDFGEYLCKYKLCTYCGGFNDSFEISKSALKKLDEMQLGRIYKMQKYHQLQNQM